MRRSSETRRSATVGATVRTWTALAVILCAPGCVRRVPRTTIERIGGATRVRAFASPTAYEAYLRAELALLRDQPEEAARQLELATTGDPDDGYLAAHRAEVMLLAGDAPGALATARDATVRFPDQAATWLALGRISLARGDQGTSSEAFSRALAIAPGDPDVRAAVARAHGASPAAVARIVETAPEARAGDRTVARRTMLALGDEWRPVLHSSRRARAQRAWEARAYDQVDRLLTPLVLADPLNVSDRVRVIEARARDGRPADAARLVAGLPIRPGIHGVTAAERARLWLVAGRAEVAAEEAERALAAAPHDALAQRVLGEALLRSGRIARGLEVLARLPAGSSHFTDARIAAARALASTGRASVADALFVRSMAQLSADSAPARDRLRLARAELLLARDAGTEADAVLASIETPWGRQHRGALSAGRAPMEQTLADLRVRTDDRTDDAVADAWIALLCLRATSACPVAERDRALASARAHAGGAPETLRAEALAAGDPRRAMELLRRAEVLDPLSPWNRVLTRQIATHGSTGSM